MTPLHFGVGKWIEKAFRRRIYEIFTTSFDPGNDTRVVSLQRGGTIRIDLSAFARCSF